MSEHGAEIASARIDRALGRIEAATQGISRSQAHLLQRHDTLRAQVAEAIAALDSLIAAEEDAD